MKRIVSILFDDRYNLIPVNHLRLSIIEDKTVNIMSKITNNNINTFTIDNFNIVYPRFILDKTKTKYYDFKKVLNSPLYSRTYQLNNRSTQSIQFDLLIDINYFNLLGINETIFKEFVLINTNRDNDDRTFYLLDYFIPSKSLCIELDSSYHDDNLDRLKDKFLESLGIKVLRIRDFNIETKTKLNSILNFIQSNPYNEFKVDYSELIILSEEHYRSLSVNKYFEEYGDLYCIKNKWVSSIINLNKYDSNILESIRYNKNYSIKISLDAIYEIIPMSRKEVDKYNSLVNYLMTLGIDMTITSNHKNKGRKKKRD